MMHGTMNVKTSIITGGYANANDFEVRLMALTVLAKDKFLCGVN
jgi:hypothetical protein